jgi:beta-lactamase class D
MRSKIILSLTIIVILFSSCKLRLTKEIHNEYKKYYDQYHVTGSFALYDKKHDKYYIFNDEQFTQNFIPASTFKICNSLIGLESGVIKDENFVIKWDGIKRWRPEWNQDQDLKTAYKNSTVWYYQELARRVDVENMKFWMNKCAYGNADTTGGVDKFWLNGGLRISPNQQIDFLQRLDLNILPFSQRNIDLVKKIMIEQDSAGVVLRSKTGWGSMDNTDIGWYIGYVKTKDNTYYFSNCIQCKVTSNEAFPMARIAIAKAIMKDLRILK